MLRLLRTTAIVLAITAGIYCIADYLVGLWRPHHLNVALTDGKAVPAYRNQPYVSEAFIREKALEPGEWQQVVGERLVTPPEYHGTYFNVDELPPTENLYRRTSTRRFPEISTLLQWPRKSHSTTPTSLPTHRARMAHGPPRRQRLWG